MVRQTGSKKKKSYLLQQNNLKFPKSDRYPPANKFLPRMLLKKLIKFCD